MHARRRRAAIPEHNDGDDATRALPAHGASAGSPPGWVLGGRYRVLGRIGAGGMAEVFRAVDELLGREVAVKVFRSAHVAQDTAHGIERQQLEVQALARLNHPNLITLYDGSIGSTADNGQAYLVMELIDGPSLSARIAQGALPEPAVREIGAQIGDGLAYVHAQGMVHRDVKPENILLGVDRSDDDSTVRARLSDFGIVRLLGAQRLTQVDSTLGTASYLAPEQARGSDVGPPADVYSLGLVLLESLTAVRAFDGPPLEAAMARLSRAPEIPATLPGPWPRLLNAMTSMDPLARPTAAQVSRALRADMTATAAVPFADSPTQALAAVAAPIDALPTRGSSGPTPPMPPVRPMPVAGGTGSGPPVPPRGTAHRRPNGWLITVAVIVALLVAILAIVLATSSGNTGGAGGGSGSSSPSSTPRSTSSRTRSQAPQPPPRTRTSSQPSTSSSSSMKSSSSSPSTSSPSTSSPSTSSSSSSPSRSTSSSSSSAAPQAQGGLTTSSPATSTSASSTSTSASPGQGG